jgi:23S rRNA G2069 N7-methylase RlmK/C1962 C5-methylase RlmI
MLSEAARLAEARGVENVRWVCSRADEFNESFENLALIVVASAFHWMDRQKVAQRGRELLPPGGVFAVTGNPNPVLQIRKREGVGAAIAEVQDRWFGQSEELSPAALESVEEVLQRGDFASVVRFEIPT